MISKHLANLPSPGAYAAACRKLAALPADARVKEPGWAGGIVSAAEMRRQVRKALDRRINIRGGQPEANEEIDIGLQRDARRLDDILNHRGRVYQFESQLCKDRFSHLLARYDD